MISLIIAMTAGIGTFLTLQNTTELHVVWNTIFALIAVITVQLLFGVFFRKKINSITEQIQRVIMEGQQKVQRKANMFQQKPAGGIKHMQKLLEKDQHASLRKALELTDQLTPWFKWSLLLNKQVSTMKMQFNYQLGEFKEVDKLLPQCMFMDPLTVAMKMAREYKNDDPQFEKTFKSKIRKFKGDKGVLLYAVYTWALLKRGETETAFKVLTEAKDKCDNEIIYKNWEALANGKPKSFSNAGFGDEWYSLKLENPKMPKQKMQKRFR
jgi:hypothetical protein